MRWDVRGGKTSTINSTGVDNITINWSNTSGKNSSGITISSSGLVVGNATSTNLIINLDSGQVKPTDPLVKDGWEPEITSSQYNTLKQILATLTISTNPSITSNSRILDQMLYALINNSRG